MSSIPEQLMAAGLSRPEAARKADLFRIAAGALERTSETPSRRVAEKHYFVPGRVEVLGKHTDYAGGRSLVGAVERGICLVARASGDPFLTITRVDSGEQARLPLDPGLAIPEGEWSSFPAVAARRLARDFGLRHGVELAFASDLPVAAGLSSGTALTIGVFLALAGGNRLTGHPLYRAHLSDPAALAEYLGCLENGRPFGPFEAGTGVGTLGGCEDQAAITLSTPGALAQVRFAPVRLERRVRIPPDFVFAVASSGVTAEKTGGAREAYNAAARAAAEIHRRWQEDSGTAAPSLGAVLAESPGALDRLRRLLGTEPTLLARLEQFAEESEEIVPAAGDALEAGEVEGFGRLVDRSQAGAEAGLGNQIPETIHLPRAARRLGAAAASAFGAGFGGSVWALVSRGEAERFLGAWRADYLHAFPQRAADARFFATAIAGGALRLPLLDDDG